MSQVPVVTVVAAAAIDAARRSQLVALVNDAFAKHEWLFPGVERTDDEDFREETEGADLLIIDGDAETGANGVAVGVVKPDDEREDALYLGMVSVARGLQGRGYGSAIVRAAEDEARRRGFARVALTAIAELGNVDYYEPKGYVVVATTARPAGYWGSSAPYVLVRMEKELRGGAAHPTEETRPR